MKKSTIALAAAGMLASAPALADAYRHTDRSMSMERTDARATIEALERRDDALQRESMASMRIGAVERRNISMQRDLIDDLIERLERGERVDPYAIDRAFAPSYHHHRG